ncbi:MAG TPA: phytase [Woeseiaceae bacterium]|nr:phytase [Woeseiaceae bacterium]
MKSTLVCGVLAVLVSACSGATVEPREPDQPSETVQPDHSAAMPQLSASASTRAAEHGGAVNAAFWTDPRSGGRSLILVAAGIGGLDFHTPDGERVGNFSEVEAGFVSVLESIELGGTASPLVIVYDSRESAINAYRLDGDALQLHAVMDEPVAIGDELTGLCHYRSPLSGSDYLFAVTDAGFTRQFELYARGDTIAVQLLRTIPAGKDSGFCAVDSAQGMLYLAEEGMGIWRMGAEPESDTTREPVDLRTPWGGLSDEVKGIGIYTVAPETSYLVVADAGESRLVFYRLADLEPLGSVAIDGLLEAEGVTVTGAPIGDRFPHGLVAIADEDAGDGGTDVKLVAWPSIAAALHLESTRTPARNTEAAAPNTVKPGVETEPARSFGDAADDPAIWVHPADPLLSLVIGTDKKFGVHVYDLDGRNVQAIPAGRLNNVDLRYDFPLGGESVALVTASNRSTDGISVFRVDADSLQLVDAGEGILPTGFTDPYGLCMYRSAASGEFYVFVNEGGDGSFRQWRLYDNGDGKVAAEQVREFSVGSQAEGCVADDEAGVLYVAEEDRGLWRYPAEPDGGSERTLIDSTGDEGRLADDVEGVALWAGADGQGYLVVSNQGADNYAVYRREGENAYVGHFHIVANAALGIDGASETDGLDVTSAPLGERYPSGLLVVQDGRNIAPEERQNFKFVSWEDVAQSLGLD